MLSNILCPPCVLAAACCCCCLPAMPCRLRRRYRPVVPPCSLCMRTPCCCVRDDSRECPVRLPAAEGPTARAQPLGSVPVRPWTCGAGAELGWALAIASARVMVAADPTPGSLPLLCWPAGWADNGYKTPFSMPQPQTLLARKSEPAT
jgi:hypothetical protein